jgi:hypothetical protein
LDIVETLEQRASVLDSELGKVRQAIRLLGIAVRQSGRKWHHTEATKRNLALAQKSGARSTRPRGEALGRQIDQTSSSLLNAGLVAPRI